LLVGLHELSCKVLAPDVLLDDVKVLRTHFIALLVLPDEGRNVHFTLSLSLVHPDDIGMLKSSEILLFSKEVVHARLVLLLRGIFRQIRRVNENLNSYFLAQLKLHVAAVTTISRKSVQAERQNHLAERSFRKNFDGQVPQMKR